MVSLHSLEGLINIIKNAYDLSEIFDINLNIKKKNPECPDVITCYLSNFDTKFSLNSRNNYDNEMGNVTYDVTVFCYFNDKNENVVHQFSLGSFPSQELYMRLENADFFENTDMFAISIATNLSAHPSVYVYIAK